MVSLGGEHCSNRFVWQQAADEAGADVRAVLPPSALPAGAWTAAVMEAIDLQTAVVAVAPVFWLDGTALDLQAVAARCREVHSLCPARAMLPVDWICHSACSCSMSV